MSLINLTINGKAVAVEEGTNILEAAKKVNIKIPNLCYLHIDDIGFDNSCASCRVCLVNADGRLVPSCATLAKEGMKVAIVASRFNEIIVNKLLGGAVDVPVQGAAARDVHGAEDEGFVHGQIEAAVPVDAPHIAQRLGERLPQRDAHILGGVVIIHLHVTVAGKHQIKAPVPRKQLQHMIQKAAAGVHLIPACTVEVQGQLDLGLVGVAFQRDHSVRHGSFLHDLVQCVHKGLHLLRGANGDAQPVFNARRIKMPHQNAVFLQLFV